MKCPKCGKENDDGAKFCKGCGGSLQSNSSSVSPMSQSKSNNNTLIICATILLAIIVIAGAFVLVNNGTDDSSANEVANDDADSSVSEDADDSSLEESHSSSMTILSESFEGEIDGRMKCSVYVGSEFAEENVKISILNKYAGSNLNEGKKVPLVVSDDGYITVRTLNPIDRAPDEAIIKIYDGSGEFLDSKTVTLS